MDDDRGEQHMDTSGISEGNRSIQASLSESSPARDTRGKAEHCPSASNDEHFQKADKSLELDLEATVAKWAERLEDSLAHKVSQIEVAMENRVNQVLDEHVEGISKYVETCFNQVCSFEDANDGQTLSQTVKDLCSRFNRAGDEVVISAMQDMLQKQDEFLERMLRREVIILTNTLGLVRHEPFDPRTAPPAYDDYHI
ncbi:hypothetical protein PGTUg99_018916 [Puccinia graminis f. sp. tritici]|uniref:Uncharacterized protein n=1 Tax=Puccinia graminis f. sp. tritici TaxID=56615 RepID=A0A5B0PFZ6_PUCGR|nr:hypothetical protein PGTUg99_018916 [Puccinia graminis f. sp. tritici]